MTAFVHIRRLLTVAGIVLALGCSDTVTIVDPAPVYADIADELQARINDLNRTLVRCWEVPSCRGQHFITWTSWDSAHAPAFIIRPKSTP